MGHSTTVFREMGFTAKDWKLEVWLHFLVREIDQMPRPPDWLCKARDYWSEQATLAINGCIGTELDRFLIDDERVAVVRKLVQHVYDSLHRFGEQVPRDFLNALCQLPQEGRGSFPHDIQTELLLSYGRALLKLLSGKMKSPEYA